MNPKISSIFYKVKKYFPLGLLLFILLIDLACREKKDGIIEEPTPSRQVTNLDSVTVIRTSLEGVNIYSHETKIQKKFEIIGCDGIKALDWSEFEEKFAKHLGDVDIDVNVNILDNGTTSLVEPESCKTKAEWYVQRKVDSWCFTPYRVGIIRYRFNVGTYRITIDTTKLYIPKSLQDTYSVPMGRIHYVLNRRGVRDSFGRW